jgi:hypothetical protein
VNVVGTKWTDTVTRGSVPICSPSCTGTCARHPITSNFTSSSPSPRDDVPRIGPKAVTDMSEMQETKKKVRYAAP